MRVGLSSDALPHLSDEDLLSWCAEREIADLELCVGPYTLQSGLDIHSNLTEAGARDRMLGKMREHGVTLSALNASANPLHPKAEARADAIGALRGAVALAEVLGVDRVLAMSGCPGSRGGGDAGLWAIWSLVLDDEPLWEWQFEQEVAPFWREISKWAGDVAPSVRICLELHPGTAVFNPASFARLSKVVGPNVGVTLDPSHFWWQSMDPVSVVNALGSAIGFAHGKDTTIYPDRARLNGVHDHRFPVDPETCVWHFSAVGAGHSVEEWSSLLQAMKKTGFDGIIAIEQEDPTQPAEASVEQSLSSLRKALAGT